MESVIKYAVGMNANQEVLAWVNTVYKNYSKKNPTSDTIEHILDYLVSDAAPRRLLKMSYKDAKRKADEWSKTNQKRGKHIKDTDDDIELVHDFLDGTKIVRLKTKSAFEREGFLMSHCVGGYNPNDSDLDIYSYRDSKNMPHATFEVRKNSGEITQIKGKGNGAIHPKYIHPILTFLETIGMKIRPNDMQNLGYYHVPASQLDYIRQLSGVEKQTTMIKGEMYAY